MSDMNQVLMNLLMGGQGGGSVEQMLSENDDLDPMTRMLVSQAFSGNREQDDDSDDEDPNEDEDDRQFRRRKAIDRLRARFEIMQEQIEEMQWHLEAMEDQNDALAAALGACYLCWGEDSDCPECRGKGKPGSSLPDRSLFRKWILPAVKAAQAAAQASVQQRLKRKAYSTQSKPEEPKNAR